MWLRHVPRPHSKVKGQINVNLTFLREMLPDEGRSDDKSVTDESGWTWPSSMNEAPWLDAPQGTTGTHGMTSRIPQLGGNYRDSGQAEFAESDGENSFLKYLLHSDTYSSYQEEESEETHDHSFLDHLKDIRTSGSSRDYEEQSEVLKQSSHPKDTWQMDGHVSTNHQANDKPKFTIPLECQLDYDTFVKSLHDRFRSPQMDNLGPTEMLSTEVLNDLFELYIKQQHQGTNNFVNTLSPEDLLSRSKRLLGIKQRYELSRRTDIPEQLYRLAPQVCPDLF